MPEQTLDDGLTHALVAAAGAAPSIHNTQPWRFRIDAPARTIHVHAAARRPLPRTDPDTRAQHISIGAALCNLQAAAVHLGWEPVVRLLPRPDAPGLLATVRLAGPPRAALLRRPDLYQAIWRRRSSRLPFSPAPVPDGIVAELAEAARLDGADLRRPGASECTRLLGLTAEADHRSTGDPALRAESRACLAGAGGSWGMPGYALGSRDAAGRLPMRTFVGPEESPVRDCAVFEPDPQLLLLTTRHDRPADWLRAGRALQHTLLLLTLHGLRASLMHQALEWPDLRGRMTDPLPDRCAPQMLIRIGYGPAGFPTPRLRTATLMEEHGLAPSTAR